MKTFSKGNDVLFAIAEIDYLYFEFERIKEVLVNRKPMEILVDQSTGYEQELLNDAKEIANRINELRKKYEL